MKCDDSASRPPQPELCGDECLGAKCRLPKGHDVHRGSNTYAGITWTKAEPESAPSRLWPRSLFADYVGRKQQLDGDCYISLSDAEAYLGRYIADGDPMFCRSIQVADLRAELKCALAQSAELRKEIVELTLRLAQLETKPLRDKEREGECR